MRLVLEGLGKLTLCQDEESGQIVQGQERFEVLACAICRTDAKMWEQGHRDLVFPRVLGHEMVVRDRMGTRYAVWPGNSCGCCVYCNSGRENLCEEMRITGFHSDGGFASSVVLSAESLVPLPESLDTHLACFAEPVGCVINAFEKLEWRVGDRLLVYGGGTMGLLTALYGEFLGLFPTVIEKDQVKIERIQTILEPSGIACHKQTSAGEYDLVINCCGDYIAFCQAIAKAGKGAQISFFSGLSKNEHIETNLLNVLHYREARVSGAYGLTKAHMEQALPFLESKSAHLRLLIEKIVEPASIPGLMGEVLSGTRLKYIVDLVDRGFTPEIVKGPAVNATETPMEIPEQELLNRILDTIIEVDTAILPRAQTKIDNKTKPLGALGKLEQLAVQLSCIQRTLTPRINRKQLLVFAADHGVTEEGVSAYPAEVTGQMVLNFLAGGAAINVLCNHNGIELKVVDMGVNADLPPHPLLISSKVAKGTRNLATQEAMTHEEMITAIEHGIELFLALDDEEPIDIVGLGEMGIGNTTSAALIISAVTGVSPAQAAGRGTGVDDQGLEHKIEVMERALRFHAPDPKDGYDILQKVGGFEIAGIVGAVLGAASRGRTVVLDGVISTAAGLLAWLICPKIVGYLIAGHRSVEVSQAEALSRMGLDPLLDFEMRLGEGTGAAMAIDMADAACKLMVEMASFAEAKVATAKIKKQHMCSPDS